MGMLIKVMAVKGAASWDHWIIPASDLRAITLLLNFGIFRCPRRLWPAGAEHSPPVRATFIQMPNIRCQRAWSAWSAEP